MSNEKKTSIFCTVCGIIVGAISGAICSNVVNSKKNKPARELGTLIIYPDDFNNDGLFLDLNCEISELKNYGYATFKVFYDKHNKKVKVKENYAKS